MKTKKVLLFITSALIACLLCMPAYADASGDYTLIGNAEITASSRFTLRICLEHCTEISGGQGAVMYDPSFLRLVSFTPISPELGGADHENDSLSGICRFFFFMSGEFNGSSTLIEVEFELLLPCEEVTVSLSQGILSNGITDTKYDDYIYNGTVVPAQTETTVQDTTVKQEETKKPAETTLPVTSAPQTTAPSEDTSNTDSTTVTERQETSTVESDIHTVSNNTQQQTSLQTQSVAPNSDSAGKIIVIVFSAVLVASAFAAAIFFIGKKRK